MPVRAICVPCVRHWCPYHLCQHKPPPCSKEAWPVSCNCSAAERAPCWPKHHSAQHSLIMGQSCGLWTINNCCPQVSLSNCVNIRMQGRHACWGAHHCEQHLRRGAALRAPRADRSLRSRKIYPTGHPGDAQGARKLHGCEPLAWIDPLLLFVKSLATVVCRSIAVVRRIKYLSSLQGTCKSRNCGIW